MLTSCSFEYQTLRGLRLKSWTSLADDHPPRALHVFCREGRAVVPLDALPQLERQSGVGRIPRPAFGEIRDDGVDGLVDLERIEYHEVVEHGRERRHRSNGRFLEQRGRGRIVVVVEPQRAALLLCNRRRGGEQGDAKQRAEDWF